ncbi:DUF2058 domain-containing protein [Amphritea balenae]|uniref:DUF2058 domain-containing protein n=1 Tax=Amphritea balenae TaxID=452629 RepID=A0A3P1SWA0_9GAMM|nr:DUF2058 domain-containing protein [Amphritea balenae]RRD01390.1 DUF2058 domain-containing protein [Amphritea balenae]GGK57463.1 hypothetical protein GCM10007941_04560 [Amphritea balenae]
MAGSLQDQLLKAGLANKKQANTAKAEKRKKTKKAKAVKKGEVYKDQEDLAREEAIAKAKTDKLERDRELNRQREDDLTRRSIDASCLQMIKQNLIAIPEHGDVEYNFVDGTKIKKLYVDKELQDQLAKGNLAIANNNDSYTLIPAGIADKITERRPELIVSRQEVEEIDPDDPYADFQIPDDLMW